MNNEIKLEDITAIGAGVTWPGTNDFEFYPNKIVDGQGNAVNAECLICGICSFAHKHEKGKKPKDFVRIEETSTELKGISANCNMANCRGLCGICPKPEFATKDRIGTIQKFEGSFQLIKSDNIFKHFIDKDYTEIEMEMYLTGKMPFRIEVDAEGQWVGKNLFRIGNDIYKHD